jgi:hypothetical protein
MDPQDIIDVCSASFEANKSACNAFVEAVSTELGVTLFSADDLANAMVDKLRAAADWTKLADGAAAKAQADAGWLVIGGLKGSDEVPPVEHGHVVVVVSGPLDPTHNKYPRAYWGKLGGVGAENQTVNFAWNPACRDLVEYFGNSLDGPAAANG